MEIYLIGEMAFAQLKNTEHSKIMLCLGTKKEVDEADEDRILQMVREAVAINRFNTEPVLIRH